MIRNENEALTIKQYEIQFIPIYLQSDEFKEKLKIHTAPKISTGQRFLSPFYLTEIFYEHYINCNRFFISRNEQQSVEHELEASL